MTFIKFLISLSILVPTASLAGSEKPVEKAPKKAEIKKPISKNSDVESLKKIVGQYKKSSGIKSQVKKTVFNSFMETTKESHGEIFFSKGRLKMSINKPDSYLLIMADDVIWLENKLNKALGGGYQVTKLKATNGMKRSNALLAFLFDDVKVWDKFKVIKAKRTKRKLRLTMVPREPGIMGEVTKVYVYLSLKSNAIIEIKYWDGLDNWTEFAFSIIDFEAKFKKSFFSYTPPKGVKPTVL